MKERIKELWSKAGGHYNSGNQHTWPEYTITDPEKFAELIVRECMAVAAKQRKPANLNYNPSERFVEDLRQHFGVSE